MKMITMAADIESEVVGQDSFASPQSLQPPASPRLSINIKKIMHIKLNMVLNVHINHKAY